MIAIADIQISVSFQEKIEQLLTWVREAVRALDQLDVRAERVYLGPNALALLREMGESTLLGLTVYPAEQTPCVSSAPEFIDCETPYQHLWRFVQSDRDERYNQRARILLYEQLSEEQISDLEEFRFFTVVGMDGHQYKIEDKPAHNVFRLEQDQPVIKYCIVIRGGAPRYDQLLSQKLLLEADIETFMAFSNKWELPSPRLQQCG